jgi:hypothetical protein
MREVNPTKILKEPGENKRVYFKAIAHRNSKKVIKTAKNDEHASFESEFC